MLADHLTRRQIVDDGGTTAGQGAAVLVGVIGLGGVQQAEPLLSQTAGAEVAVQAGRALELVIDHQGDARAFERETGHAVRLSRREQAVGHGVAALGYDLVGKALGQVEQPVRVAHQRTVAMNLVDVGFFAGGLGGGVARQTGEGGGGAGGDQAATVKDHEKAPKVSAPDASE